MQLGIICAVHIEDCDQRLAVVQLLWLSGRALVAQARSVLSLTVSLLTSLYFYLITSKFLKVRCSEHLSPHYNVLFHCMVFHCTGCGEAVG